MSTKPTNTRLWLNHKIKRANEEGILEEVTVRLHTPVSIEASVIDEDTPNRQRLLRLKYQDEEEEAQFVDVVAAAAVQSSGKELIFILRSLGVLMTKAGVTHLVEMVRENQPPDAIHQYSRLGWRDSFFLCPNGETINTNQRVEIVAARSKDYVEKNGTLEGWKSGAYQAAQYHHFGLAICMSFVGVLIDLLKLDTIIIMLTGESSHGKSTSQKLGASSWGDVRLGKGLFVSCAATSNAIEAQFEQASGTYSAHDDATLIGAEQLRTMIYLSSGGTGKARMTQQANPKKSYSWNTILSISTEVGLSQKFRSEGLSVPGGLTVRTMEVSYDDMPTLPRAEMDQIEAAFSNVGHAGPEFVRQIVREGYVGDRERLRTELMVIAKQIAGDAAVSQKLRAAMIPALIKKAGEIAKRCGLLPDDFNPAAAARKMWSEALKSDIAPASNKDRALDALRESILTHKGVDIVPPDEDPYRARVGWYIEDYWEGTASVAVYVIPTRQAAKLSGNIIEVKSLAAADMLIPRKDGKGNAHDSVKGVGQVSSYIIKASMIEGEGGVTGKGKAASAEDEPAD